jgi:hypothetical protein
MLRLPDLHGVICYPPASSLRPEEVAHPAIKNSAET